MTIRAWSRRRSFRCRRSLGLEGALEEGGGGLVGGEPILVEQEAVEFVGEDEFLDGDVVGAQGFGEDRGLGVGDVGVVVAVDQEDGRTPAVDGGDGGTGAGLGGDGVHLGEGALLPVGGVVFEVPVVNAVEVDAGGEEVGVAREGEGGEIAAVAAAPYADAFGVDAGKGAKIFCGGEDVVVLGATVGAGVLALAEVEAIADAAAVVDGEHDEALGGEVLIHRVGVGVVAHGGVAEEHLAIGTAVEEEDGGARGVRGGWGVGDEELAVEVQAVDGGEEDLPWGDERGGIIGGNGVGAYGGDLAVGGDEGGMDGQVCVGDEGDEGSVRGDLWMSLDAVSTG